MTTNRWVAWSVLAALGIIGSQTHCGVHDGEPAGPGAPERTSLVAAAAMGAATGPGCVATCDPANRVCSFTDGAQTLCGACKKGYVANAAGACVTAQTCAGNPCSAGQLCDDSGPTAVCLSACAPGSVWDVGLSACRPPITCATLSCSGVGQLCAPAAGSVTDGGVEAGTDAGADAAAAVTSPIADAICRCPAGSGFDPTTNRCLGCTNSGKSCANIPGASGGLISSGQAGGNWCECDTTDNYFLDPNDDQPTPCDADGDGWVNALAQEGVEWSSSSSIPAFYHAAARCHVRQVSTVVLQGESGKTISIDLSKITASGVLPLYEDVSLDTASGASYASVDQGRAVNSLTKGCVAPDGTDSDFNGNAVADVDEAPVSSTTQLATALTERYTSNSSLLTYFVLYSQLSYFLELNSGWYELPPPGATGGTYRIAERHRADGAGADGVAINDKSDPADFWQVCPTGPDALLNPSLPGYDFASPFAPSLPATTSLGYLVMGHSSQFRCVHVFDSQSYGASTESTAPQNVYVTPVQNPDGGTYTGTLSRTTAQGQAVPYPSWETETCTPGATVNRPPPALLSENPSFPTLSCVDGFGGDPASPPLTDVVRWVAIDGQDPDEAPYQRGCENLCLDSKTNGGGCSAPASCTHSSGYAFCGCPADYASVTPPCACPPGMQPNPNDATHCIDIDECQFPQKVCGAGTYCVNGIATKTNGATYTCLSCPPGYSGTGSEGEASCQFIDLCGTQSPSVMCTYSQRCVHSDVPPYGLPQKYSCQLCTPAGTDSDGWACGTGNACGTCPTNEQCQPTQWGWTCECLSPLVIHNGACVRQDPCNWTCTTNQVCSGGTCVCATGYVLENGKCVKDVQPACPCGGTPGHCKIVCPPGQ